MIVMMILMMIIMSVVIIFRKMMRASSGSIGSSRPTPHLPTASSDQAALCVGGGSGAGWEGDHGLSNLLPSAYLVATCSDSDIPTCTYTYLPTYLPTYTHACMHTCIHSSIHKRSRAGHSRTDKRKTISEG